MLSTLFWSQIQNIAPYKLQWRQLTLSQPKANTYGLQIFVQRQWLFHTSLSATLSALISFADTVYQPLHSKSSDQYLELPVCFFLYNLILNFTHKISPLPFLSIHLCCAACTQAFDVQCNLFFVPSAQTACININFSALWFISLHFCITSQVIISFP